MSEAATPSVPRHRSPFEGHKPGQRPAPDGQIGVGLRAETVPGLWLVHCWPSGVARLRAALAAACGMTNVPEQTGQVAAAASSLLICTGPCEYQILSMQHAGSVPDLRQYVTAEVGAVTDLGHARCCIHIEGARCRDTLSKLFALDLREAAWPLGELRLTGHHHVPCAAYRTGRDSFELLVFSTYAFDQLGTVLDAAQEYGVELEVPGESPA